jgi:hypothetical protein
MKGAANMPWHEPQLTGTSGKATVREGQGKLTPAENFYQGGAPPSPKRKGGDEITRQLHPAGRFSVWLLLSGAGGDSGAIRSRFVHEPVRPGAKRSQQDRRKGSKMTALEWIQQYENYLALAKNRSVNTVRSYIRDAELLSGEFPFVSRPLFFGFNIFSFSVALWIARLHPFVFSSQREGTNP